jgi:hypothetical protein
MASTNHDDLFAYVGGTETGATTTDEDRAQASMMRVGEGRALDASSSETGSSFPTVQIDDGIQKYVLIEATEPSTSKIVHLVRGEFMF